MRGLVWFEDCPVALEDLRKVGVDFWGLDDKRHLGSLVVHQSVAKEVALLFQRFYEAHIHFESIKPMRELGGNDELSMEKNNTSAFNCRAVTGVEKHFSQHAYGLAIDINPRWNPYIKGKLVLPKNARAYDPKHCLKQQNCANNLVVKALKDAGWAWGGDWHSLKDYQHFEKAMALK